MQLLVDLPNEPQAIHVIRRGPREIPTRTFNSSETTSSNEPDSNEQRPAPSAGLTIHSEPVFDNQGDVVMHVLGEDSQEGPSFPPPSSPSSPTNPLRADPFHLDLAAQGYSSSFQSTFSLTDVGTSAGTGLREGRSYDIIGTSYPDYMLDTLSFASDSRDYHPLWRYILEYWFPSTSGFEVVQNWDPESSYGYHVQQDSQNEDPPKCLPSFAVFDTAFPTQPFLFLFLQGGSTCDFTRLRARNIAEEGFETLRACSFTSGFKSLCVMSAIDAKWGMFVREPGWLEGDTSLDYVGEWQEDVTSDGSFGVMGYCFEEMKKDIVVMRGQRR